MIVLLLPFRASFFNSTNRFGAPACSIRDQPGRIIRLVLEDAVRSGLIGVAVGLAVAVPLAHFMARLLVDVHPNDVVVLGGVTLLLVSVAVCAAYVAARRAGRVDPMITLRVE